DTPDSPAHPGAPCRIAPPVPWSAPCLVARLARFPAPSAPLPRAPSARPDCRAGLRWRVGAPCIRRSGRVRVPDLPLSLRALILLGGQRVPVTAKQIIVD